MISNITEYCEIERFGGSFNDALIWWLGEFERYLKNDPNFSYCNYVRTNFG